MRVNDKMRRPGDDKHPLLLKSCNSFNAEKKYIVYLLKIFSKLHFSCLVYDF